MNTLQTAFEKEVFMVQKKMVASDVIHPDPKFSELEIQAMQRAVIKLFDQWQLADRDAAVLLGGIAPRTYQRWKEGKLGRVGPDLAA